MREKSGYGYAKAIDFLEKDYLTNVSMIEPLRRGTAELVVQHESGVLIRMKDEDINMAAAADKEGLMALLDHLENPEMLVIHRENITAEVLGRYPALSGMTPCIQSVYVKKEPPKIGVGTDIRLLDQSYFSVIRTHYQAVQDDEYISFLIDSRVMHGIFIEEELAGFVGMHSEGSIGLLEVFPEYRGRGLGTELQKYMICDNIRRGFVPFGQVKCDNRKSIKLQKKLGMEMSQGLLWWYF